MYSINCIKWIPAWIKKNWKKADGKPVQNIPYLKDLWNEYNKCQRKINIYHVRSHTSNNDKHSIGNDMADKLATESLTK